MSQQYSRERLMVNALEEIQDIAAHTNMMESVTALHSRILTMGRIASLVLKGLERAAGSSYGEQYLECANQQIKGVL